MRSASRVFVVLSFVLLLASFLAAQNTTSLRGTVTDPKGAVIAGAAVTIANPATGFTRTTKSDGQGAYQFLELPPAKYDVTVSAAGFAPVKQTGMELLVATPGTLNVTVQVTGGTVTVEVAGTAPLVNTQDASLGHAFEADQIASLPFEGRDPTGILSLQTGVVFTGNSSHISSQSDSRSGSVNGARSDQTNVTLDGVDNNDQLLGTAFQGAIRVPLDALEEFKVTTSSSDADTGRSSGGQVSLVTKSGTNKIHGSFYIYNRPTFTTANDWFNKAVQLQANESNTPPFLLRNTFGANIGGPIIKDKLFFFAAYEGQRKREDISATRVIPSLNMQQGIMSYPCSDDPTCPSSGVQTLTAAQIAGMDPNCSGNGTCPLGPGPNPLLANISGANPGALFPQYPAANTDTVGDGFNYRGYIFNSPLPQSLNAYVLKLDYHLTRSGNHLLFARAIANNDREADRNISASVTGDGGEMFPGEPQAQLEHDNNKGFTAGYTATFSSTLINNLRFGYVSQLINTQGQQTQPYINFRGMDNLIAQTPTVFTHVPVKNIVDDLTKVFGTHSFQFGFNYRRVDNIRQSNAQNFFQGITNVYWLDDSAIANTGSSLDPAAFGYPAVNADYGASYDFAMAALTGLITQVNSNYELNKSLSLIPQGQLVPRHFRDNEYEMYAQDQWRMKPNFTMTYGLRYSILEPPYETNGTQVSPTISLHDWFVQRGLAAYNGQVYNVANPNGIGFTLSGQANGKQPYWGYDYKDIAPRLAFAYQPKGDGWTRTLFGGPGKTSIRAGYGLYFDHFGEGITNTFDRNGSFGLTTAEVNPAGIQSVDESARFSGLNNIPASSGLGPLIAPPPTGPFPVYPPQGAATPGGFAITWGLDDKLKTPYSHVVDFSITRELPSNFVLEVSYVGRFAHRLLQEVDLAEPTNLRDTVGGQTYFQAAQALARQYTTGGSAAADISTITPALVGNYWQDLFPGAAGPASTQISGCAPNANNITTVTATQAMYDLYTCFAGNETTALEIADAFCFPQCSQLPGQAGPTPYNYYDSQFSSLYAWASSGNSAYNAGQFSLRHRTGGLTFDINYTYSKSIDQGSNAERISEFEGFGLGSQIINSWFPRQNRAVSDFDTTQIFNANWVYELPFGKGKHFGGGMNGVTNALFGGWTLSGLWRYSTGYPFSTFSPAWSTNYQLETQGVLVDPNVKPKTGSYIVPLQAGGTGPNVFQQGNNAVSYFRAAYPGEAGWRNGLRGPGTFNIDTNLLKSWHFAEDRYITFNWSLFNVTNSPRFDVGTMSLNGNTSLSSVTSFGNFSSTLSNARVMEFGLRFTF